MTPDECAERLASTPLHVLDLSRIVAGPRDRLAPTTMPFPGFLFHLRGRVEVAFGDDRHTLARPALVHAGANLPFSVRFSDPASWEYVLVIYELRDELVPEGVDAFDPETSWCLEVDESPVLERTLHALERAHAASGGIARLQVEALFRSALAEALRCAQDPVHADSAALFARADAYICDHYAERIGVADLAACLSVSTGSLAYAFRTHAQCAPGAYLRQYRLDRARELIVGTGLPMARIAQATGFSDAYQFSKAFKRRFDMPPSELRRAERDASA